MKNGVLLVFYRPITSFMISGRNFYHFQLCFFKLKTTKPKCCRYYFLYLLMIIVTLVILVSGSRDNIDMNGPQFESLPLPDALSLPSSSGTLSVVQQSSSSSGSPSVDHLQPVFPERSDAAYFIVAVHGGAKVWSRILAKTLMDMGPPIGSPLGPPLRPIYVDLPNSGR